MYSLGIVMWEIATLDIPFEEYLKEAQTQHVVIEKLIKEQLRPTIPRFACVAVVTHMSVIGMAP
jgi:hypothetical protein